MPDLTAFTDLDVGVDIGAFVDTDTWISGVVRFLAQVLSPAATYIGELTLRIESWKSFFQKIENSVRVASS